MTLLKLKSYYNIGQSDGSAWRYIPMFRIILMLSLSALLISCSPGEERADVKVSFQQTLPNASSSEYAKIITAETRCIILETDREEGNQVTVEFMVGVPVGVGVLNVPAGVNKFTLTSYTGGSDDSSKPSECSGDVIESFSVDADIKSDEYNTLLLLPLRANWETIEAFNPHAFQYTDGRADSAFDVNFDKQITLEQDIDPYTGDPVRNSYDLHISYEPASVVDPVDGSDLLPQFVKSSDNAIPVSVKTLYEKILFETEQYTGLFSICSPFRSDSVGDATGECNLRLKSVPNVGRADGDLQANNINLVSNFGVYAVEDGITLLSVGFDPCTYLTHESPLDNMTCSFTAVSPDSLVGDITESLKLTTRSVVKTAAIDESVMELRFVETLITGQINDGESSFLVDTTETGSIGQGGPSTSNYAYVNYFGNIIPEISSLNLGNADLEQCYYGTLITINTVSDHPLSPNYGQDDFDPKLSKTLKFKADICFQPATRKFYPQPSTVASTQVQLETSITPELGGEQDKGSFTYTKEDDSSIATSSLYQIVSEDYYNRLLIEEDNEVAKIGSGILDYTGEIYEAGVTTAYDYDIGDFKVSMSNADTVSAARFWVYDYRDLYIQDVTDVGVVIDPDSPD